MDGIGFLLMIAAFLGIAYLITKDESYYEDYEDDDLYEYMIPINKIFGNEDESFGEI